MADVVDHPLRDQELGQLHQRRDRAVGADHRVSQLEQRIRAGIQATRRNDL
jgi:hypothetical protein